MTPKQEEDLIRKVDAILLALGGSKETGQRGMSSMLSDLTSDFDAHSKQDERQFEAINKTIARVAGMTQAIAIIWTVVIAAVGIWIGLR